MYIMFVHVLYRSLKLLDPVNKISKTVVGGVVQKSTVLTIVRVWPTIIEAR